MRVRLRRVARIRVDGTGRLNGPAGFPATATPVKSNGTVAQPLRLPLPGIVFPRPATHLPYFSRRRPAMRLPVFQHAGGVCRPTDHLSQAGEPVRSRPSFSTRQSAVAPDGGNSGYTARGDGAPTSARIERTRPSGRDPSWRMEHNDVHGRPDGRNEEYDPPVPSGTAETVAETRAPIENSRLGQNFRSRFAKPPKAYDLDEVGDKGLPLDLLEEGENANFQTADEIAQPPEAETSAPRGETKPSEVIRRRSRVDFSSRGARPREESRPQRADDFPAGQSFDDFSQQAPDPRRSSPDAYAPPPAPVPAPQTEYYIEDDAVATAPNANFADEQQAFDPAPREPYQVQRESDTSVDPYDQFQDYGDDQHQPEVTAQTQDPHQEFYSDPYDAAPSDQFAAPPAQPDDDPYGDLDDFEPLPDYDDPIDPQDSDSAHADRNGFPGRRSRTLC